VWYNNRRRELEQELLEVRRREGEKERRREGEKERRREGGKEGRREGEKERRREGGKERRREGEKEGRREGGEQRELGLEDQLGELELGGCRGCGRCGQCGGRDCGPRSGGGDGVVEFAVARVFT